MDRIVGLIAALSLAQVLGWAAPARAQVAAPEIAPAAVRVLASRLAINPQLNIAPDNPGALLWGTPSRVAVGVLRGTQSEQTDGASSAHEGTYGGFRWVQSRTALAAEVLDYDVEFGAQTAAGGSAYAPKVSKRHRTVALAFNWPESLALGVSSERTAQSAVSSPLGTTSAVDFEGWVAGLSWRLGENVFLGWGYGQEEATLTQPAQPDPLKRDHSMTGIAFRGGGSVIWRIEADVYARENFEDASGQALIAGYDLSVYSLEALLGSWLFGYTGYDGGLKQLAGSAETDVQGFTADFGIAPLPGMVLSFRYEFSEVFVNAQRASKESVRSLTLGWQF